MLQAVPPQSHADAPSFDLHTIPGVVERARARFRSFTTRPLRWRLQQLEGLKRFVDENEDAIYDALAADVGKPRTEAFVSEVRFTTKDIEHAMAHLEGWMKPARVSTPLMLQPSRGEVRPEPLGVSLIISPWNYPVQLLLGPLVGAISAGCCAVLKPSEVAPRTSRLMAEHLARYIDAECYPVVEGGVPETTALLKQRFDHIFYTGNETVARIVMRAAAENLTPVTLELGGKSPTIVDASADLEVAAHRIAYSKFSNAGQTCVAPDYVLVHEAVHDELVARLVACVREFYGDDPQNSPDFGRIVNRRHVTRLARLLDSGTKAIGGRVDEDDRYVAPTIVTDIRPDAPIMQEEIFGPILPVLKVRSVDEAIAFINERPKPLALFCFSKDPNAQERVLERTSSGAANINQGWMHMACPNLPFGGVGTSGMGAYHGKYSFETFSHRKAVLRMSTVVEHPVSYPPYVAWKRRALELVM